MDSSPTQPKPISRDEISSGALSRQRRARLLVQRILERLRSPQPPEGEPDDPLARQLAGMRLRASAPPPTLQAGDLLEAPERWLDLLPTEPLLRAEVLVQLQQRVGLQPNEAAALQRLAAPRTRRWIPWQPTFQLQTPAAWPVGVKLGGVMLLLSLVPALLVGNVGSWLAEGQAEQALKKQLQGTAATLAGRLDENLSEYGKLILFLASNPAVIRMAVASAGERHLLGPEVLGLLDRLQASHSDAAFIYLIDRTGRCFASSDRKLIGHDYSFRTYVQQGVRQEAYPSWRELADAPFLSAADMRWYYSHYAPDPDDWRAAPLCGDLRDLPPTLVISAMHNILRDEALLLGQRLEQEGGTVWQRPVAGVFHDFVLFGQAIAAAHQEQERIGRLLRETAAAPA